MPNGTSGGVGGSEVQTRSLPDEELVPGIYEISGRQK